MNKLDQWKSTTKEVRRSMIAHSLAKAIRKIELPFDISIKGISFNLSKFDMPIRLIVFYPLSEVRLGPENLSVKSVYAAT